MVDYLAFFGGRVRAEVKGSQLERFINDCHRHRIRMTKLKRIDENRLQFTVPARAFRKLRQPAFRSGSKVHILKKSGLFMAIRPYRKRWGIVIGLMLFLFLVYYCSGYIWSIKVLGCETVSATQIAQDLQKMGLVVGAPRKLDVNKIENQYLIGNDKLKWMSINIRGTTAYVEVREQGIPPKMVEQGTPTNIYAQRDGVILSVDAYAGSPCVTAGQPVMAGDLLVTGDWTDSYGIRRLIHCLASVKAKTCRTHTVQVPFAEIQRQKNGKNRKFFAISLGKLRIPLYFKKKIDYNKYDTVFWERMLTLGDLALPIGLSCQTAYEIQEVPITRTEVSVKEMAYTQLGFYEEDFLADVRILNRTLTESTTAQAFVLNAVYECEEEIGIPLPIEGVTDAENSEESG